MKTRPTTKATLTPKQRQCIIRVVTKNLLAEIVDAAQYHTDGLRAGGFADFVSLSDAEYQAVCEMTAREDSAIVTEIKARLRPALIQAISRLLCK